LPNKKINRTENPAYSMQKSFITGIGYAVPKFSVSQQDSIRLMSQVLKLSDTEENRLKALYRASGIKKRHTVVEDYTKLPADFEWLPKSLVNEQFPAIAERMKLFRQEALPLSIQAVESLKEDYPSNKLSEVTHLITISCTGMYAPGLDIDLVHRLSLANNVQRTAINFMGCYGVFNGLKVADSICRSNPEAKVLLVSTELCTIHFQPGNSEDETLSAALFADGSAAALIESVPTKGISFEIEKGYTDLFPEGDADMAWQIGNQGFEMILSSYVPKLLNKGVKGFIDGLLKGTALKTEDISHWVIHPGGKQIINSIEEALQIPKSYNEISRTILEEYGNMSSATVLFVLKELKKTLSKENENQSVLSMAFGPGLTLEALLYKIVHC